MSSHFATFLSVAVCRARFCARGTTILIGRFSQYFLSRDFKYEPGLVMADGDYVSVHGRYTGWGPKPMIAVDVFRVANGRIAEHWDVLQEEVPAAQSANGNSMFIDP